MLVLDKKGDEATELLVDLIQQQEEFDIDSEDSEGSEDEREGVA
jgi:hypothetical protein